MNTVDKDFSPQAPRPSSGNAFDPESRWLSPDAENNHKRVNLQLLSSFSLSFRLFPLGLFPFLERVFSVPKGTCLNVLMLSVRYSVVSASAPKLYFCLRCKESWPYFTPAF